MGIGQIRRHTDDANLAGNDQRNLMLFWRQPLLTQNMHQLRYEIVTECKQRSRPPYMFLIIISCQITREQSARKLFRRLRHEQDAFRTNQEKTHSFSARQIFGNLRLKVSCVNIERIFKMSAPQRTRTGREV